MPPTIGIRREDKNEWERRVPITPDHVRQLTKEGIAVIVQPSGIRAFPDESYREAGAVIQDDLSGCALVLAVKEIPVALFRAKRTYMFFAHVIKGQPHNMPMLQKLLDLGCSLIDYEKVVDDQNRRLIFFGRHAGLAGMTDTLWALGQRLESEGIPTPFSGIQQTRHYKDLAAVKEAVRKVGGKIEAEGLPASLVPMVFGFAGYGNVSLGAQEIFDLLPHREVKPEELKRVHDEKPGQIVKVVFREEHMVEPKDPATPFDLQEYYDHPERYQGTFSEYVPYLSVLANCIYWAPQYPHLVTREDVRKLYASGSHSLRILGDISCDVNGAIECNLKCTEVGDPVYVYQVKTDSVSPGVQGDGPVVLAVDNLPCELPVESSRDFGDALMPFLSTIVRCDYRKPFEHLDLPAPILRAVIAHQGQLTPDYAYISEHLDRNSGGKS
jgi:alpha-aminoadipic semialdehyde synthase